MNDSVTERQTQKSVTGFLNGVAKRRLAAAAKHFATSGKSGLAILLADKWITHRRSLFRLGIALSNLLMQKFDALGSIQQDKKDNIRAKVRKASVLFYIAFYEQQGIAEIAEICVSIGLTITFFCLAISSPLIAKYDIHSRVAVTFLTIVLNALLSILTLAAIWLPIHVAEGTGKALGFSMVARRPIVELALWAVLLGCCLSFLRAGLPHRFPIVSLIAFAQIITGFGYCATYILLSFLMDTMCAVALRLSIRSGRYKPASEVVVRFTALLADTEKQSGQWGTRKLNNDLSEQIEAIAVALENIPVGMDSRDPTNNRSFQYRMAQIAQTVRSLKMWLLFPKVDTREHFVAQVSDYFVYSVLGTWDRMWEASEQIIDRKWYMRIGGTVRSLAIALLPSVCLGVFHWLYRKTEVPAFIAAPILVWTVVQLLSIVDPNLGTKVTAYKETMGTITLPGKDKKP